MLFGNTFLAARFLVDEIIYFADICIAIKKCAMRGQTVATCAPDLLIIVLDAFGQIKVNDEAHIGFVDAHAERDGSNDDLHIIADKRLLVFAAIRIIHPRMIRADRIMFGGEIRGEFVHLFARETIDDARLIFIAFKDFDGL